MFKWQKPHSCINMNLLILVVFYYHVLTKIVLLLIITYYESRVIISNIINNTYLTTIYGDLPFLSNVWLALTTPRNQTQEPYSLVIVALSEKA